jgi:hypothetical protein
LRKVKSQPDKRNVLAKYAEQMKSLLLGTLYKIADLSRMTLRVYVMKPNCPNKSGTKVTVKIDTDTEMKSILERFLGLLLLQNLLQKSFKPKKNLN